MTTVLENSLAELREELRAFKRTYVDGYDLLLKCFDAYDKRLDVTEKRVARLEDSIERLIINVKAIS